MKKSKRFTNEESAKSFAKQFKGELRDLRGIPNAKNFKVIYTKEAVKDYYKGIKDAYEEWYDECNLDGSFAYNGAADDF